MQNPFSKLFRSLALIGIASVAVFLLIPSFPSGVETSRSTLDWILILFGSILIVTSIFILNRIWRGKRP